MLTQIHFLLTYTCTFKCDHCFLYSSPEATGTFTIERLRSVFDEIVKIPSLDMVYFEGGEPFLFYPILMEGLRLAKSNGLQSGIVTNAFWAETLTDARTWLAPLADMGITDFSISDDEFHDQGSASENVAFARQVCRELNIPCDTICIEKPQAVEASINPDEKGLPVTGGSVKFKGRAADTLTSGVLLHNPEDFDECPYEDLEAPGRVHIDSIGNVQICQGISIGNYLETPLSRIISEYDSAKHPICEPLIKGGPIRLAAKHKFHMAAGYADACHLCFATRRQLLDKYQGILEPRQVYGIGD